MPSPLSHERNTNVIRPNETITILSFFDHKSKGAGNAVMVRGSIAENAAVQGGRQTRIGVVRTV